ncbi:MAG TPA: zinc ABC transporter substrate-binding protein, partial [Myxococcota bacterium]|nr:zinc ABC transporter substrate-binding protein [Myxococcota bacterium]
IEAMKQQKAQLVVREVAYELPLAQTVAERTGARVVTISTLTGGLPGADTYIDFVDANLKALVGALSTAGSP